MTARTDRGADRLQSAIRAAAAERRPALAPFLTAGFPRRAGFAELLQRVAAAADLVEIGVPFSDPMADGVTIQNASHAALRDGVTTEWILGLLAATPPTRPWVLMSYLNPLLSYGFERLAAESRGAGVCGLIVPDLPFEECIELRDVLDRAGVALVQLVTPVTPEARMRRLCAESRGFVYAVTTTGTTGGEAGRSDAVLEYLDRVRRNSSLPVLAGFGIRAAAQLERLRGHCDGVIVGSALIEVVERGADPVAFLRGLSAKHGAAAEERA